MEKEFSCLGCLGIQGSKEKKVDLRNSDQLLRVVFPTFCGQKEFKFLKNVCFEHQKLKKPPSKVAQNSSNPFFFLTALIAQTAQTEEFLFQNVAY